MFRIKHPRIEAKNGGPAVQCDLVAYWGPVGKRSGLAHPALRGLVQLRNASAALAALDSLRERLPVAMQDVRRGLAEVSLPGRFQVLPGRPQVVLDVAHNPQAATVLASHTPWRVRDWAAGSTAQHSSQLKPA